MIRYTPRTVSYAKELTSAYILFTQGNGFNAPLSIFYILYTQSGVVVLLAFRTVLPRAPVIKIMYVHYLHPQG